jgi:hypothetical protein
MPKNTFLTFIGALVIFVCGYGLGYLSADTAQSVIEKTGTQMSDTANSVADVVTNTDPAPVVENGDDVAFVIDVSSIPETQRAFLTTMGIEGNEIVVTKTMLACAEASIGVERMAEIQYGATPSMSEGLKLAGCY